MTWAYACLPALKTRQFQTMTTAIKRLRQFMLAALNFAPAALGCLMLGGCMGAPIAQQLLSSVVMHGADNIMADAYEAQQREAMNNRVLHDAAPDEYWASFVSAGFEKITPVEEPLPVAEESTEKPALPATVMATIQTSPFVRVEVWNMLVGEEKLSVLERAYALGNVELPPREDWAELRVAIGAMPGKEDQPIVFLVPPGLGKLQSGQETIIELDQAGDLNIARYAAY